MKYAGIKLEGRKPDVVVIPRAECDVVIKAAAVPDYEKFEKLCPAPNPPEVIKKGGEISHDIEDPEYKKRLTDWADKKTDWLIIESLRATEELEWDTVDYGKPETWSNWKQELKDSGFVDAEIARIIHTVWDACGLNQAKIDEATKSFLAGQREVSGSKSSRISELANIASGKLANGLV
jgi:hypothetical protein